MKDIVESIKNGQLMKTKSIMTLGDFRELTKDLDDNLKLKVYCQEVSWGPSFTLNIKEFTKSGNSIEFQVQMKHNR